MINEIKRLVTHMRPHFEEAVALWLAKLEGESRFPGVRQATIEFWPSGPRTPDGKPIADYKNRGYLAIGVGGGRYDEHPNGDNGRKDGKCAATLLATDLGIREDPRYRALLDAALGNDQGSGFAPWDLSSCMLVLQHTHNDLEILEWTWIGLGAYLHRSDTTETFSAVGTVDAIAKALGLSQKLVQRFRKHAEHYDRKAKGALDIFTIYRQIWQQDGEKRANRWLTHVVTAASHEAQLAIDAAEEIRRDGRTREVTVGDRRIRIFSVRSDNPLVARLARHRKHGGHEVVIVQKHSGNIAILTAPAARDGLNLSEAARLIRLAERKARRFDGPSIDDDALRAEGSNVPGATMWHFTGWALLNGSHSNPDAEPTKLSLDEIAHIIIRAIEQDTRRR